MVVSGPLGPHFDRLLCANAVCTAGVLYGAGNYSRKSTVGRGGLAWVGLAVENALEPSFTNCLARHAPKWGVWFNDILVDSSRVFW